MGLVLLAILSYLLLPFVMVYRMTFSFAKLTQVVQGCSCVLQQDRSIKRVGDNYEKVTFVSASI